MLSPSYKSAPQHLTAWACRRADIFWLTQHSIFQRHQSQIVPWPFLTPLLQLKRKMPTCQTTSATPAVMRKDSDMEQATCTHMHTETIGLHSNIFRTHL